MNRLILILSCGFLFLGCKPSKVITAEKFKVKSGIPKGTPVYRYKITVQIKKQSIFKSIELGSMKPKTKFSVINQETKMQSDNSKSYPKGTYILQFDKKIDSKSDTAKILIQRIDNAEKKTFKVQTLETTLVTGKTKQNR